MQDKKGTIIAKELSDADATKVKSEQDFFKQYLKVTTHDGFVKAKEKQRRKTHTSKK